MCHYFVSIGEFAAAFLCAAGFDGFLRTRELLSLVWNDVHVGADGNGVIALGHAKTGQQTAAFEASVIYDPVVIDLYLLARANAPIGTSCDFYIFQGNESRFYDLFARALEVLDLQALGFRPYSLRRGGATAHYRATRNLPATIERGRWATVRVARIYINDGLATDVELRLSSVIRRSLHARARALLRALQQGRSGLRPPSAAGRFSSRQ